MASIKIVALGSSFAAGPGIEPVIDHHARRSSRNYANLLAEKLNANLLDLTVSGATLSNVLDTPQTVGWNTPTFPPQLSQLPSDTDIVTLTAGGNDLGYSTGMIVESLLNSLPRFMSWPLSYFLQPSISTITVDELAGRLMAIIDKIHNIAPNAKIYLVKYIAVFGPNTQPNTSNVPLSQESIDRYMNLKNILSDAYDLAAAASARSDLGVEVIVVQMDDLSKGHEVGSEDPWVSGFVFDWGRVLGFGSGGGGGGGSGGDKTEVAMYHPNTRGHVAVAEELIRLVERGDR